MKGKSMLVNTNYQSNTNFRALNAVRFESEVFKRYPESRNIIINAFNKNSAIKNFSDYFETKVLFKTRILDLPKNYYYNLDVDDEINNLETTMIVEYKEPLSRYASLKEKIKHFFSPAKKFSMGFCSDGFDPENFAKFILETKTFFLQGGPFFKVCI